MYYELLCEIVLEVLQDFRTEAKRLQEANNQLAREIEDRKFNYSVLENEHTNLILERNQLQTENNKLILERNQLQTDCGRLVADRDQLRDDTARLAKGWDDCENKLKELQSKNNELKMILKDRGVIVIDDSIVREEPK